MKYFKNTSWLFGEKILRMVVGLFVGIWVARYLGPEQFGLFSYAQSFVGLFVVIAGLGLDSIIVRELVKDESKRDALLGTAFRLKLIGAFLVLIALAIAVNLSQQDSLTTLLIFTIASATIFQSFNVIDFYFQARVLSKYIVYANIISLLISSVVKIGLILNDSSLLYFAYSVLFDSFILICGFLYFYRYKTLFLSRWYFDKKLAKKLLKGSLPLILAGVINSIQMKIDQVMINEILGSTEVGYYAVAVNLSAVWFSIGVIICNSVFPAIINAKKISEELYYLRIQKLFIFLVAISYALSISVYFLSEKIISVLYGEVFISAAPVLAIQIFSVIFVYLGVSSGRWMISENKSVLNLYRNLLGVIVNILANIFLIKKYGIIGAAYASLLAYIVSFYIFDIFTKKTRKIFIMKSKSLCFLR